MIDFRLALPAAIIDRQAGRLIAYHVYSSKSDDKNINSSTPTDTKELNS